LIFTNLAIKFVPLVTRASKRYELRSRRLFDKCLSYECRFPHLAFLAASSVVYVRNIQTIVCIRNISRQITKSSGALLSSA